VRRLAVLAAWVGLAALEVLVARTYVGFGTWWHWLLHQQVGWGVGLATAALVATVSRWRPPAVVALLGGQLASILPDLQFRFARMPHEPSMDVWLGHISLHTGPSPVLVALGALLLGGWAYVAVTLRRRRVAVPLALGALVLVLVACLLARPLPTTLADHPADSAPVALFSGDNPGISAYARQHTGEEVVRLLEYSSDE